MMYEVTPAGAPVQKSMICPLRLLPVVATVPGPAGGVVCAAMAAESMVPTANTAVSVNGPYVVLPLRPDRVYDVAPELIPVTVVNPEPDKLYDV